MFGDVGHSQSISKQKPSEGTAIIWRKYRKTKSKHQDLVLGKRLLRDHILNSQEGFNESIKTLFNTYFRLDVALWKERTNNASTCNEFESNATSLHLVRAGHICKVLYTRVKDKWGWFANIGQFWFMDRGIVLNERKPPEEAYQLKSPLQNESPL